MHHLKTVDCHQGSIRAVRYNVDGSYLLTCGTDKKIKLWNPLTGLLLKTYGGHAEEVTDACGSCDSCHIISSSLDKSIIYWDVTTAQPLRRLRCHPGPIRCVRFNEDSKLAVSGGHDNMVMCWDVRSRKNEPIQVMKDAKDCITNIIITDYDIIVSSLDSSIRHYDLRVGSVLCDNITEPVTYTSLTKDGHCILAACFDGVLRLIDSDNGDLLSEYRGHKAEDFRIECGIINNDSKIVTGSADGNVIVYDLVEEKENYRFKIGNGVVSSLAIHPTKSDICFTSYREFQLWSANPTIDNSES